MSDFTPGQRVRVNAPGDSEHGKVVTVHAATEARVYVNVECGAVWMYFHNEVTEELAVPSEL